MEAKIITIIVTYNRKKLLEKCLDAVLEQTYQVDKIIIINNCSTDGTDNLFKEGAKYHQDKIEFYTTEHNLGGAGGFAEGFKSANRYKYDWLWVMDDDVIPGRHALEELLKAKAIIKERKVGFLASSIYGPHKEPLNVPVVDKRTERNGYQFWYKYLDKGLVKIRSATFVSVLIPYIAVKQLGIPIAEYFIWGDDTEYTTRLSRYYGDSYICGKSKAVHYRINAKNLSILNETDPYRIKNYYYYYRNSLLTARKYNPLWNYIAHIFEFHLTACRCLFEKESKHRILKFITVERGIFSCLFGSVKIKKILRGISGEHS